jgi:hypothetical protein
MEGEIKTLYTEPYMPLTSLSLSSSFLLAPFYVHSLALSSVSEEKERDVLFTFLLHHAPRMMSLTFPLYVCESKSVTVSRLVEIKVKGAACCLFVVSLKTRRDFPSTRTNLRRKKMSSLYSRFFFETIREERRV